MTLHHLVTVYLFVFSYMSNTMIGAPVAFLHNWADVIISWTRIWAESKYSGSIGGYSFVISQIVWFYTRIWVFPQLIYATTIFLDANFVSPYVQPIYGLLLGCLAVMHVYWFILMQGIMFTFLFKGVADDTVNNNKVKEQPKE
jgi:TLC domain